MRTLKNGFRACAIAIATLALPPAALAEPVIPPENSAATQYTEAIPTGGGRKDASQAGDRGEVSAAAVLGARQAKRLEAHGKEGREVAEVIAATAPGPAPAASAAAPPPAAEDGSEPAPPAREDGEARLDASGGAPGQAEQPSGSAAEREVQIPAGSSGVGEVLAQATGSSSTGQLGVLLPLLVLATIAWAVAFLWRGRRRAA